MSTHNQYPAMKFIAKYSSEVTIKTRPVRKQFSRRLHANIKRVFKRQGLSADVILRWDMIEVVSCGKSAPEDIIDALSNIPGIAHFLAVKEKSIYVADNQQAIEIDETEKVLQAIYQHTLDVVGDSLANKYFAVRCKRQGKQSFTSHDVERYVGGGLNQNTQAAGVRLRKPDVTVALEIKEDRLFIVEKRIEGIGGYPISTVEPILSLISGGFDSSVSSYDCIRRGMPTHYCFFNLGGHAHEVGVKQAAYYLWEKYGSSHRTAFVTVNFESVVEEILHKVDNAYMGVILKRMMVRAASAVARAMDIEALVTGECVAQVSSQTLKNLSVIDSVTDTLIIRPLATWDKSEIIRRAEAIGVAQFAEHMPEYCAVISDKPTTAAKRDRVIAQEEKMDLGILDAAINDRQVVGIDTIYAQETGLDDVEIVAIPEPQQIVIDIRNDEEIERKPIVLHANKTLHIPFYKINRQFSELDKEQSYLLYCDKGVMSKLHAAHLKADGYENVKVYRPAKAGSV